MNLIISLIPFVLAGLGLPAGYYLGSITKEELRSTWLNYLEISIFFILSTILILQLLIHKTILITISLMIILMIIYVRDFRLTLVRYGIAAVITLISIPYESVWLIMCSLLLAYGLANGSNLYLFRKIIKQKQTVEPQKYSE